MLKKILLFIAVFTVIASNSAQAKMRCVVLDVGEGQAVLLQRDEYAVLIDTGHFGKSYPLLSALEKYGVKTLEKVMLTHLHPDHASGIFTVMYHFPDTKIYESGHRVDLQPSTDSIRWVAEQLDTGQWDVKKVIQGSFLEWRGVKIDVLWPQIIAGDSLNRMSLVININYGLKNILLMSDADTYVEEQLMKNNSLPGNIELLVVGHHGAIDATSEKFLDELSPQAAVISVNKENIRGYPHRTVVERINSRKIPLHITARDGDFAIVLE
ncbi:MAG: competence protein ComEC [Desulforhopalus sp.]|jgi:competence protein ComEC